MIRALTARMSERALVIAVGMLVSTIATLVTFQPASAIHLLPPGDQLYDLAQVVVGLAPGDRPGAIDVQPLPAEHALVITDATGGLWRFPDTDNLTLADGTLLRQFPRGDAMGLAAIANRIFLCQATSGLVVEVGLDGEVLDTLAALPGASGLDADPARGRLFVSTHGLGGNSMPLWQIDLSDSCPPACTPIMFTPPAGPWPVEPPGETGDGLSASVMGDTLFAAQRNADNYGRDIHLYDVASHSYRAYIFVECDDITPCTVEGEDDLDAIVVASPANGCKLPAALYVSDHDGGIWAVNVGVGGSQHLTHGPGEFGSYLAVDPSDSTLLACFGNTVYRLATVPPPNAVDQPFMLALVLETAAPNPATTVLKIAFTLPNRGPAMLELIDVAGRRVWRREVGSLGPGRHQVDIATNAGPFQGLYFVRLAAEGHFKSGRVVILR